MSIEAQLLAAAMIAAVYPVSASAEPEKLTVERLNAEPSLNGPSLRGAKMSPDGKRVTILKGREDDARQLDLWSYDLATGESAMLVSSTDLLGAPEELSEEEKNRRERQRIYQSGIVAYDWDNKGEVLLFPLGGDVFLYDLTAKAADRVTETEAFETDPKISPEGGYVSFIRNDELYVYDRASGRERQLTSGANGVIRNGVASFVVQEELDRDTGYWWSNDDSMIAYTQIDESPVEISERLDMGKDGAYTVRQRYPFAGTDNVTIKLGVVKPKGGRTTWIDLGDNPDIYLADVHWSKDGSALYVERLSRDQKTLDLLKADPKTGRTEVILSDTSDTWVNLTHGFRALDGGGFLWTSERSGFSHIYKYDSAGTLEETVTSGEWPVKTIACVDEENGEVYFSGWMDSVLESHLFKVSMSGGEPQQITEREGSHGASFPENDCSAYIGGFSGETQPYQLGVYTSSGERLMWLNENRVDESHPYYPYLGSHQTSEYGTLEAEDGTPLYYSVTKPAGMKRGEKRPAIVFVYGGPHAQTVRKGWSGATKQLYLDEGFVVFQIDNRGAASRGTAFENTLYRDMGHIEVEDQAVGARWLASQSYVDGDRIGVSGWSYGGYMALMMLSQHPELYAAGVAGAPVTDWRLYDTAYTERYMGDPRVDVEAYDKSSVFAHLDGLKGEGELLVIHGMADDNVVFLNTVRLMAELQKAGKKFELMTFPGEKHGFRQRENRLYRDRLMLDFLKRKLKAD